MSETIYQAAALIIPLVLAIVFHEVAHGWAARALGDPTAARLGRLSLNPLRHVDPVGTVILPGLLKLMGGPVFGWAKPVPVNMWMLRNPRRDMMLVGAAGPGANFVLAAAGAVLLGLLVRIVDGGEPGEAALFIAENLKNFLFINIFLALFNLLPVPPFDGSHIVEGLLPRELAERYAALRPYGLPLMLVLLLVVPSLFPAFNIIGWLVMPPFEWLTAHYLQLAGAVAGG